MTKTKKTYLVYGRQVFISSEDSFCKDWWFFGKTYAVSEAKAISNIRFRRIGVVEPDVVIDGKTYKVKVELKAEVETD